MLRALVGCALALLAAAAPLAAESLWGLFPGMSAWDALQRLGKPSEVREKADTVEYHYVNQFGPGSRFVLEASREDNGVTSVVAYQTSPDVTTEKGVKVGDRRSQVSRRYGPPRSTSRSTVGERPCFVDLYQFSTSLGTQRLSLLFDRRDSRLFMMVLGRREWYN